MYCQDLEEFPYDFCVENKSDIMLAMWLVEGLRRFEPISGFGPKINTRETAVPEPSEIPAEDFIPEIQVSVPKDWEKHKNIRDTNHTGGFVYAGSNNLPFMEPGVYYQTATPLIQWDTSESIRASYIAIVRAELEQKGKIRSDQLMRLEPVYFLEKNSSVVLKVSILKEKIARESL